jgi:hypothetical protein
LKNNLYNTFDVKRCCENKLRIKLRGKKELKGWFLVDEKKTARISVPTGRKFIPPKTYKSMATQLKLTVEQFDGLLECPLGYNDYVMLLQDLQKM